MKLWFCQPKRMDGGGPTVGAQLMQQRNDINCLNLYIIFLTILILYNIHLYVSNFASKRCDRKVLVYEQTPP